MESDLKRCPYCAEPIQALAIRCRYCRSDLLVTSTLDAEASRQRDETIGRDEIPDLLGLLADRSLVTLDLSTGRFHLLESVRAYARGRLAEAGDADAWRSRHMDHFLDLATQAEPGLKGPEQGEWLEVLERDLDNLRAAFSTSLKHDRPSPEEGGANLQLALAAAGALLRFWDRKSHLSDGRGWSARILDAAPPNVTSERAAALNCAGILAWRQGEYAEALSLLSESLVIRKELGDRKKVAESLNSLGMVYSEQEDRGAARIYYEESLAIRRELGDRHGAAATMGNLATILQDEGRISEARSASEAALTAYRAVGDVAGIANTLDNLTIIACDQRDLEAAKSWAVESLRLKSKAGIRMQLPDSFGNFGEIHAAGGSPAMAALFWGAEEKLREELHQPRVPILQARHEDLAAQAQRELGDRPAFDSAWASGRAMSLDQLVRIALEGFEAPEVN